VLWRTYPHRNRNVNRGWQNDRYLREFWWRKLREVRRGYREKGLRHGRWRREVVIRVAEKDCWLLQIRTFLRQRWRNIVCDGAQVWRWLERSVQKRKPAIAIARVRAC
jgi:hypothetical protein